MEILTENFDNRSKKEFKHLFNKKAGIFIVILIPDSGCNGFSVNRSPELRSIKIFYNLNPFL